MWPHLESKGALLNNPLVPPLRKERELLYAKERTGDQRLCCLERKGSPPNDSSVILPVSKGKRYLPKGGHMIRTSPLEKEGRSVKEKTDDPCGLTLERKGSPPNDLCALPLERKVASPKKL